MPRIGAQKGGQLSRTQILAIGQVQLGQKRPQHGRLNGVPRHRRARQSVSEVGDEGSGGGGHLRFGRGGQVGDASGAQGGQVESERGAGEGGQGGRGSGEMFGGEGGASSGQVYFGADEAYDGALGGVAAEVLGRFKEGVVGLDVAGGGGLEGALEGEAPDVAVFVGGGDVVEGLAVAYPDGVEALGIEEKFGRSGGGYVAGFDAVYLDDAHGDTGYEGDLSIVVQ
mmetsp:Transcript_21987/g.50128  ORF Transcript_21987/g.50128 Transcript_21987/m.50128 type:complete len:226 (-) Transcript_21987:709-1386(-)